MLLIEENIMFSIRTCNDYPQWGVHTKLMRMETVGVLTDSAEDEDIVCSHKKL
ncbi:Uncharacterised protein [Oligella urethralis]|nr:Uncharacterised protein [Oligella urethralis]